MTDLIYSIFSMADLDPFDTLIQLFLLTGGKLTEYTATGNPVTFETNAAKPLRSLTLPFTPIQSGTGDPSPTNVRPISGWTGVNVYHSGEDTTDYDTIPVVFPALGKNLLDVTKTSKIVPGASGSTITIENGVISIDAVANSARSYVVFSQTFPAGTYSIQAQNSGAVSMPRFLCSKEFSGASFNTYYGMYMKQLTANELTFTVSESCVIGLVLSNTAGESGNPGTLYDIQLETGETASTFEPFTNTVYGGSLDLVSGVLTVEWAGKKLSEIITNHETNWDGRFTGRVSDMAQSSFSANVVMCSCYKSSITTANDCIICVSGKNIYLRDTRYETVEAFAEAMGDYYAYYKLAEPLTYQLTPTDIQTLIGDNVIWSDTNGTNSATYLKKG